MRALRLALLIAAVCTAGCPSAYQKTYDQEFGRLEAERRAQEQQQEALRQEARKYVAVVLFAVDSAAIDDEGLRELDWFLRKIQSYPQAYVEISGFADSTGSEANNQPLSNRRAWAVRDYLVSRGIPADRISAIGYGSQHPAEANATAKGRRQNRRAEVRVR